MKCYRNGFCLLVVATTSMSAMAVVSPPDLIKVDQKTRQQCVEYYDYRGEMYCSTRALNTEPVNPAIRDYEKQNLVFDDRPWQAAWGKKTDSEVMVEYVPMGDDINNWHELVTSQFFAGLQDKATPRQFADMIIEGLQKSGFKPIVTIHKENNDVIIFEFRLEKPVEQQQDEIQVIKRGKDGLYVLHYVIKKSDMGAKKRALWLKNLTNSSIKSSS